MMYRGIRIERIERQGTVCWRAPELGSELAVNIATMRRWIDIHLSEWGG